MSNTKWLVPEWTKMWPPMSGQRHSFGLTVRWKLSTLQGYSCGLKNLHRSALGFRAILSGFLAFRYVSFAADA